MQKFDAERYLSFLSDQLIRKCKTQKIKLTRIWASDLPSAPGVYIFRNKQTIIYVGETGNLRGRMKDMIDTRNHVLRRNIGNKLYRNVKGFAAATSKRKFNNVIEHMLNTYIKKNLTICYLTTVLGRKELEEKIQQEFKPRYNQKGLRKTF